MRRQLIWSFVAVAVFGALPAQPQTSSAVQALPTGCELYDGVTPPKNPLLSAPLSTYGKKGVIACYVAKAGLKTGDHDSWGDTYWISSEAPKDYKLRWSEAHAGALWTGLGYKGATADHHCGVRDEGDAAPSPLNKDGKREGQAFWATCIIWERDDRHVLVKSNIQGWKDGIPGSGKPPLYQAIDGTLELWTIWFPITAP